MREQVTYESLKKDFLDGLSEDSVVSYQACLNLFNSIDRVKYGRDNIIRKLEEAQKHNSDNLFLIYRLRKELARKNDSISYMASELKEVYETLSKIKDTLKLNEETSRDLD